MQPSYLPLTPSEISSLPPSSLININIGILGHVDSGKTSLVKALTTLPSTASLDKNPQSQQRGITLDLGFSCFMARSPKLPPEMALQVTLVDCPGHASLIKTIIGGASIIDMMVLVLDVNKGVQTQTAECMVIGELLIPRLIIVLNKIDLIPEIEREEILKKKTETLRKIFQKTKFKDNLIFIPLSANVGGHESQKTIGIEGLYKALIEETPIPQRLEIKEEFLFLIDHCFPIKGQGSVVTGTVVKGTIKSGDEIEFPQIKDRKKVKSMQMFHKPIEKAIQGDRIGLLFANLDSKLIERGIACHPGVLKTCDFLVISVRKINYYKQVIKTKGKFHITIDHQTVMGSILFFGGSNKGNFNPISKLECTFYKFNPEEEYSYIEELNSKEEAENMVFCLISLEKPLIVGLGGLIIGAKFDSDINSNSCRLAFYGNILWFHQKKEGVGIKVYKMKKREGSFEKLIDNYTILVKNLFKKETNIEAFIGKAVMFKGQLGKIQGAFGKSGKVKAIFDADILGKEGEETKENELVGSSVVLSYKKYVKIEKFLS